jgi:hypothetical protein
MQQRINENRSLENRPLGDLFGDLATDMGNLVRQEVALAKVEISQKAKYVGRNVGYLVIGGAVAYAAVLAIIAALIMLLAKMVPHWGAALIVGAVVGGIGWMLIGKAMMALQQTDLTPRETVETLKEDATWMKQQIK